MPPIRLGSRDLLEYNEAYGVLICRECQFAIQKSAISSHLLRHKIYRNERQRLLVSVAELNLHEPEHVSLPSPGSPAIDGLPIIPGYCCTWDGCESLCASVKRMRRHHSEVHGIGKLSNEDFLARSAKLQTFFRGTKLRYFEVIPPLADDNIDYRHSVSRTDGNESAALENVDENESEDVAMSDVASAMPRSQLPSNCLGSTHQPSNSLGIDLDTLAYFYHYTMVVSLTLPVQRQEPHFWQAEVVQKALKCQWLMCGLLAMSACHLTISTDDAGMDETHRQQSTLLASRFYEGRADLMRNNSMSLSGDAELRKASDQVGRILQCALWALHKVNVDGGAELEEETPFSLSSLITMVRGMNYINTAYSEGEHQEVVFAQAKRILEDDIRTIRNYSGAGLALLDRLRLLPSQLSSIFGRPDHVQDVLATLSALAALVVSCETSFVSREAWQGIAGWLTMTTEHFDNMIATNKPAALVLVAYWAMLVSRAEECGYWFLRNVAGKIWQEVSGQLESSNSAIRNLLEDLMNKSTD
jgi:hypothetical protein